MTSVPEHYCARGELCKLYDPKTGKPQKLGRYHKGDVCNQCRKAESDADFEAHQSALSVKYERVRQGKSPLKTRLVLLKRNLVARLIARRGGYWEAIREVRSRWQLDPVPTQLPPESDDILYPTSVPTREPPRPMEYILPPDIPNRHMGEPGDLEQYEAWLYDRKRWMFDLSDVLRRGVPERYLEEKTPPYVGWPSSQERWLPWYKFAAGCVLYDPPPEEAPAFADYGGLPLLPGERTKDNPTPVVLTERMLREGAIDLMVQNIMGHKISEKAWELRSELGELDFRQARREVSSRFHDELEEEHNRVAQELHEREIKLDAPHRYYVEFVAGETKDKDMLNALSAIRAKEGHTSEGGRNSEGDLPPVMCTVLLKKPGWTSEGLASQLGLSTKRVQELEREGQEFLDAGDFPNRQRR